MSGMQHALQVLTPMLYLIALVAYWSQRDRDDDARFRRLPLALAAIALVAHAGLLALRWDAIDQLPWTNVFDVMSSLAFLMAVTYVVVELASRVAATGFHLLVAPFAMVTYACAFGPRDPIARPHDHEAEFVLHTVPAVSALAALSVSGIYGFLHLRLARAMRRKDFGGLFRRLPSLEVLARMNLWAAAVGFLLVTAGIGVGASLYDEMKGPLDLLEPKVFMTLLVWTVLLMPMFGKLTGRWSDRATAIVSVVTVGLIFASILAASLPIPGLGGR